MSGQHPPLALSSEDAPAALETEATRTAAGIAGVSRRLLEHPELREHPRVLAALRNLEEQFGYDDENPGRHRSASDGRASQQISDASGYDLKPNPLNATTAAEFVETLRQYRAWSGDPSWRAMAIQADQAVVFSTMYNAMNSDALPRWEVMKAIIIGCGGGEDDLRPFASAWRRLAFGKARQRTLAELNPHHEFSPALPVVPEDSTLSSELGFH